MPIDLEAIIAIVMGISIVLIPVAGLTARFALKPTVEALARLFEHRGLEETVDILERRMGFLETRMESMDTSLQRLADAVEFDSELRAPEVRRSLASGSTGRKDPGHPGEATAPGGIPSDAEADAAAGSESEGEAGGSGPRGA